MFDYSIEQVICFTGGTAAQGDTRAWASHASIDSRQVGAGGLFFALPGERSDGHDHVHDAAMAGACGAVVSQTLSADTLSSLPEGFCVITVADCAVALGRLAAAHREQAHVSVVGITGSAGKTTTKDMTRAVIGASCRVLATQGNMNNELGVPLTLLRLEHAHQLAVIEMAMRAPGDIAYLASLARPDVGIVTNVGAAHIGELGSIEAIARAKAELVESLPRHGAAVLNGDDPLVSRMAEAAGCRVITYGLGEGLLVRAAELVESSDSTSFLLTIDGKVAPMRFSVPLPGRHNVLNALAALAAGYSIGLQPEEMWRGLGEFVPSAMRMQFISMPDGRTIIDDTYNANPVSTMCAIDAALQYAAGRRVVAVLGDMFELGPDAVAFHERVGRYAAGRGVAGLVAMGPLSKNTAAGAIAEGMPVSNVAQCDDAHAAARSGMAMGMPGDVYLVKGSRGMRMEQVVEALQRCGR